MAFIKLNVVHTVCLGVSLILIINSYIFLCRITLLVSVLGK